MVNIKIMRSESGRIYGVTVTGHAGYATYGSDILCSAISVLTLSTINGLEQVVQAKIEQSVSEGQTYFVLTEQNDENTMAASQILLQSFSNAVYNIANENPNYVTAAYEEVKK